ncbi:MAG: hypothetical protein K1X55_11145 [Chitinophagales bacterium]|nr:hypothetical protein [Chitinophagales bacterium]
MKHLFLLVLMGLLFNTACKKEQPSSNLTNTNLSLPFGKQKPVPFKLSDYKKKLMAQGIDANDVTANYVYCRFTPKDEKELERLLSLNLQLSPYPLDREIIQSTNTWGNEETPSYYIVLEKEEYDNISISKTILEEMFIPEEEQEKIKAHARVASTGLTGKLTIKDPVTQTQKPLSGVKVIGSDWFYYAESITDANGNYQLPNPYFGGANIYYRLDNNQLEMRLLDGNAILSIFVPITYWVNYQYTNTNRTDNIMPNDGRSREFFYAFSFLHGWNQFKSYANTNNIQTPTTKLNIWLAKNPTAEADRFYAVPMLRASNGVNQTSAEAIIKQALLASNWDPILVDIITPTLANWIGGTVSVGPDVFFSYNPIGTNWPDYNYMQTVIHEYGHVSHFAIAGPSMWNKIVEQIATAAIANNFDPLSPRYGYGTEPNAAYTALSESWAEDLSWEIMKSLYGDLTVYFPYYNTYNSFSAVQDLIRLNTNTSYQSNWIPYGVHFDLTDNGETEIGITDNVGITSFGQLYQQLSANNDSIGSYLTNVKTNIYSGSISQVDDLINSYDTKYHIRGN